MIKIINNTTLNYRQLGTIIDLIIKDNEEYTIYVGKQEISIVEAYNQSIRVFIRYLKRYTEWRFDLVEKVEE